MPNRWSDSAVIRNKQIESGLDITFHKVFLPIYIELLKKYKPKRVIDIGTGTGHLAKYLRPYCHTMSAIEPSLGMYKIAKETLNNINVELSNNSSYNYNNPELFDFAYSHMCAHTVDSLADFFISIRSIVNLNGIFIFTIPHPCFYNLYKNYFGEDYTYMKTMHKSIDLTISKDKDNIIKGVPYYHHPLSHYINCLCDSNFVVNNMIEMWPSNDVRSEYEESWKAPRYCLLICTAIA